MKRSDRRSGPDALSGFEGRDIRTLIDARALQRGSHPFLIWQPFDAAAQTWTYAEFRDAVRRFAAGLHARGIQPGQRLLVHFHKALVGFRGDGAG